MSKPEPLYGTKAWELARRAVIARDGGRCRVCGRSTAGKGNAHVDHIQPRSTRPDLELILTNLRLLCASCHSRKTTSRDGGYGNRKKDGKVKSPTNLDGTPTDPDHPWNQ